MSKRPKTTGEHIVALYGHITGLKKSINKIETNDLKHIHQDIDKIDQKIDTITNWIIYGLGGFAVVLLGQLLYFFSN
tara:strand:+ start:802 stop:1032 length:231 start_codon:yes stop_codon:yes gene_type:complete